MRDKTMLVRICCYLLVLQQLVDAHRRDAGLTTTAPQDSRGWLQGGWHIVPSRLHVDWDTHSRIPMHGDPVVDGNHQITMDHSNVAEENKNNAEGRGKNHLKKYKRYMLPLLLAYKLKFFTLIPILIGGLVLLTGATGLAGFFFALFAATMGLKGGDH